MLLTPKQFTVGLFGLGADLVRLFLLILRSLTMIEIVGRDKTGFTTRPVFDLNHIERTS